MITSAFRQILLGWYADYGRDLSWLFLQPGL